MTRKNEMINEIKDAKANGTTHVWYGHEENAEPISIDAAITDIEQMDEDVIGEALGEPIRKNRSKRESSAKQAPG